MAVVHSEKHNPRGSFQSWVRSHREIIRFFLIFIVALGSLSFILERDATQASLVTPHLSQVATICGKIMNLVGTDCEVDGSLISSGRFSVQVIKGCESIYVTAMLWSAMLAFPATWKQKLVGMIAGAAILFVINIIRVITMFYVGVFFPSLFDMIHIYGWQALFILITLTVWLVWAARVSPGKTRVDL